MLQTLPLQSQGAGSRRCCYLQLLSKSTSELRKDVLVGLMQYSSVASWLQAKAVVAASGVWRHGQIV